MAANPFQGQAPANVVRHRLSVSDIERLAKAGVQVKWEDIESQVRPDEPAKDRSWTDPALTQVIVDRWMMVHPDGLNQPRNRIPFDLAATRHGDKVYVFASYVEGFMQAGGRSKTEPCILTDDAALFPSDALMTKLIFMQENAK